MFRIKDILKDSTIDGKKGTVVLLAEKVGLPQPNMSNIVNNKAKPSWENLQKIADVLGVHIFELFEQAEKEGIIGIIRYKGKPYQINSIEDIENLLNDIKGEKIYMNLKK